MDQDPPDYLQLPPPTIKLQSSDGEIFEVEVKVAELSLHIKDMLDDLGVEENETIPIPQNAPKISGAILGKIIQWANHHKHKCDPATAEYHEEEMKPTDDISSWDAEFLQLDDATLFQMIRAANYLDIKGLLDVTCKKVAEMMEGMTAMEVRLKFRIRNDFSADEEEQVRKGIQWCEGAYFAANGRLVVNRNVMRRVPANSTRNMDDESRQVIGDCLSNSVVVRKLFQGVSNLQLLELSCVNKMWSFEARSLMKKRGNVIAHLSCGTYRRCRERFETFGAHLREINVVPYSGIRIAMHSGDHTGGAAAMDNQTYRAIRDRLVLKHFSVEFFGKWWKHKDCPALLLVKKIFQNFSGKLETLTLNIDGNREKFLERFLRGCNFPRLKVLKLEDVYDTFDETYTSYIKKLVSRAPNLKNLHTSGPINLIVNMLEGSDAILWHRHEIHAPFVEIAESVMDALRMERLVLEYTGLQFDLQRFNRIAPMLLQASSQSLRSFNVNAVLAVPLMCYGISFENVDHLVMVIHNDQLERHAPRILSIVKDFDFTCIFPNVNKVEIICKNVPNFSLNHMNAIIQQAQGVLGEPFPDRAAHVKELYLNSHNFLSGTAPFFAEMFPTIQKLEVEAVSEEKQIPFGSIWNYWADLEELKVTGRVIPNTGNLDSVFCGIFPEEVAELRQKDEEYLKRVNIVPVMPSITCLKNLKSISISRHECSWGPYGEEGSFMFSKVTGLIAFKRCPSLDVILKFRPYRVISATSHLEAFATVTSY